MGLTFSDLFERKVKEENPSWLIRGMISAEDKVYALGTDTKILSRLFELISYPLIKVIANESGLMLELSSTQTVYPDFTLYKNKESKKKIAVDIKSTYRRGGRPFNFTLGSYTSFLRNNTKNILYPYDEYAEHWVIGFVYSRNISGSKAENIVKLSERGKIVPPYKNIEFFVQEKYKIAGERPGSGNTANIGSILSGNLEDFRKGIGPFSKLGEDVFRDYWANYGRSTRRPYSNLQEYFEWKKNE